MSAIESGSQQAWQEEFFDTHERTTPSADHQTSWHLTGIGVTLGVVALLLLSL